MNKKLLSVIALLFVAVLSINFASASYGYNADYDHYVRETRDSWGNTYTEKTTRNDGFRKSTTYTKIEDNYGSYWNNRYYQNGYQGFNVRTPLNNYWQTGSYGSDNTGWYHRGYAYDDSVRPTYYKYMYNPNEFYNGDYYNWRYNGNYGTRCNSISYCNR